MSIIGNPLLLGGGKSDVFAFIVVTYPAGSTLTATKNGKVLTAGDTSGLWVFEIPEAGTWTITSTLGNKTKSTNVLISTKGESKAIQLFYNYYLYNLGAEVDGGYTAYAYRPSTSESNTQKPTITRNTDTIKFELASASSSNAGTVFVTNLIDVTNFSKMCIDVTEYSAPADNNYVRMGLTKTRANNYVVSAGKTIKGVQIFELDISEITGEQNVFINMYSGSEKKNVTFRQWWLE